jgi:sulfoxide reductase heme-binding subunit YedZ
LSATIDDVIKRPFILFGMTALLLMIPLAITSPTGMIKRLGAARWKRLHKLVYLSAIAGVAHFYLFVKADHSMPIAFIVILVALLTYRALSGKFSVLRRTRKPMAVAR